MSPRIAAVGVLLALAGCGGNLLSPAPQNARTPEIAELERQVLELKQNTVVQEVEIRRLRREVERLEGELETARSGAAPAPAPPTPPPVRTSAPVIEEDLEDPPPSAPPTRSERASPEPANPEETETLYDEGYTLFHQQQFEAAEERFQRFLRLSATSDLSDNAQFWIGECRFARGDYDGALAAFTATVERYPGGNKVPDAMVKAGLCLEALGDLEGAIQTYREIEQRFRGTAAASRARERLAALR